MRLGRWWWGLVALHRLVTLRGRVGLHGAVVVGGRRRGRGFLGRFLVRADHGIDFARRRIDVREALTDVRGTLVRGTPKTHERRSVPFPTFLDAPLRERAAGKRLDEPLFVSSRGLEMRNGNFRDRKSVV